MSERIYLSPPHMGGEELKFVHEAFESNWIAPLGPQVSAFEKEVASYVGTKGALAVNSGTAAIHLGLRLLGVGSGDKVFCSTLTFIGSVNPILYLNAEPVFIDSEPESWNMSPNALKRALEDAAENNDLPKAVIVVNIYGQSTDMDPILDLCDEYSVPVLEDAAESLGAFYKGKPSGTFGKYGIFSFNGNKIITTSGGGMLVSNDTEGLEKARFWATQARDPASYYQHSEMGYNYRMSNILAAIGRGQLRVLDDRVKRRREIFDTYKSELGSIPGVRFMPEAEFGKSNRWLTVMTLDPEIIQKSPFELVDYLEEQNIESRPVWKPMHMQPLFEGKKYYTHEENRSISDILFKTGICLPSGTAMTERDLERVIDAIRKFLDV
ncbi:MAG: aminotransferase class I/II-fold pyridoxal phosphate-dependent enzyme [Bacillota bacterium]